MKNGLYSIATKGFDGVEWPPGGVFFLRNGVLLGGSSFMYYIGSYSTEDGIFKGECVLNPHAPPPPSHLYFNEKDIGAGFSGTYEGDQAELTATVLLGKRSLTLQLTLRKLADIEEPWDRLIVEDVLCPRRRCDGHYEFAVRPTRPILALTDVRS